MINNPEYTVVEAYKSFFNSAPKITVKAPGRINLIGEHTDYSEGFVLPVAIDRNVSIALSPLNRPVIDIHSIDFNDHSRISLDNFNKSLGDWQSYIQGVAWVMEKAFGKLKGWQGVISGNIPIGAGLSSSAAFEVAITKALAMVNHLDLSNSEIAKIGRRAEIEWVGVNVGIMDQLISAAGKSGTAMKLDCRSLDYEYIHIPANIRFVILDTMTRRELTQSAYNKRHDEVNLAASLLGVHSLRDASLEILEDNKSILSPTIYRRAKHVISENVRVDMFCDAMKNNDLLKMGNLLNQSHESLRDDFEVSSRELNIIVELSKQHDCCLGARMMGAGFGGCALAICKDQDLSNFTEDIHHSYLSEAGIEPQTYEVHSSDGVQFTKIVE